MDEMHEKSDAQLLRGYAQHGDEAAFREIVTRHTDLVYSVAVRCVNSPDLACDIAQSVFTDLSSKARPLAEKLADGASLVGWLYRSTRFAALNQLRNDHRRLAHERQAMEQLLSNSETAPDWDRIRPVLDEAMDNLSDEDRDALLLRYFKNHGFRDVGLALGLSDDAAQKRVSRAVERLREFFAKRGVTAGASGLVVVISANAVQAAPAGLAVTISTSAALAGGAVQTSTALAATKAIAMTTLQKTIIGTTLAAVVSTSIYEARQNFRLREQNQTLQQQQAPLIGQIQRLAHERDDANSKLDALQQENEHLRRDTAELAKLRGEIARLRNDSRDLAQLKAAETQMTNTITSLKSVLTARGHTASARTRATPALVVGLSTRRKPRRLVNSNVRPSGNRPVENVSWDELQRAGGFLDQINASDVRAQLSRQASLPITVLRLPSEAEWEYAARGGSHWRDGFRYSGSNNIDRVAWYDRKHGDHLQVITQGEPPSSAGLPVIWRRETIRGSGFRSLPIYGCAGANQKLDHFQLVSVSAV